MGFNVGHTDDDLVLGIQNGSEEDFALLFKRYEGKLMGYLISKLKNQEIADEVFQITWAKVLDNVHKFKFNNTFSSWLFTIATNTLKDWFKKTANQKKALEALRNEDTIRKEDSSALSDQNLNLDFLNSKSKKMIELQYIDGLTSKEISLKMNVSEANVRKTVSRARLEIKKHILNGGSL